MKKSRSSNLGFYLVLVILIFAAYFVFSSSQGRDQELSLPKFEQQMEDGTVANVIISQSKTAPTGTLEVTIKGDDQTYAVNVPDVNAVQKRMDDEGFTHYYYEKVPQGNWLTDNIPLFVMLAIVILFFVFLNRQAAAAASMNGNGQMMNFGKSRASMTQGEDHKVTFSDVAGLREEKEELKEIVDFLKNPGKYTRLGARIPKGVLLVGPPGTGKTLLAKAVAGEAGVPFFSISGSDFVEMFVGVGASRVRDLFQEAKDHAPCIIFIDEIDAVGRRRGTGLGGGHDEREQTVNQLLVEMDGFGVNEGIIVMAATNRVDILDPALMRAGRFDRKVAVGRPDVRGREEILRVHSRNKPLGDDVDLEEVARTTAGFSGADLENLMNEAAILAAERNESYLTKADITQAFIKVGIGAEKKSHIISDKEKRITAYHESGHAILFHVLPDVGPVYTVSIIPTGTGAAGYTMPLPGRDEMFMTRGRMLQEIIVSLGGRAAEELVLEDITTGASQDIKQATKMARDMVTKYGFSNKVGLITYGSDDDDVFIGYDLAHAKSYGDETARQIDEEVKRIIDESYARAKEIILEHRDVLEKSCELLMEKEKITQEEFEALFQDRHPSDEEREEAIQSTIADAVEECEMDERSWVKPEKPASESKAEDTPEEGTESVPEEGVKIAPEENAEVSEETETVSGGQPGENPDRDAEDTGKE